MTTFVWLLFSSTGLVAALVAIAAWIVARPASRAARRALVAVTTVYLLASIYAVPLAASWLLTSGYHQFARNDVPPGPTALVVLGSGVETVVGWANQFAVPDDIEAERVLETYRVYQLLNPRWVIASGGNPNGEDGYETSSVNMKRLFVQLGIPADKILLQSTSRDTHEEAVLLADMIRAIHAQHVVLVTSAVHMRRAVGAFRAARVNVVPAIAPDSEYFDSWPHFLLPTPHGLTYSAEVAHEFLGLAYYVVRGWWKR